jgi:transketolase
LTRFVTKEDFGASAPYKVLAEKFGYTAENVYTIAKEIA